jgi:hypothetical protein
MWIVRIALTRPHAFIVLALMVLIMRFTNNDRGRRRIRLDDLTSSGRTLVLKAPSSRRAYKKSRVINEM